MGWLALNVLIAYLLGSLSGSVLLGKLRHVDIRQLGSGNAGGTNAFRTQGLMFALGVVLIDIGKGVVSARWVAGLIGPAPDHLQLAALACGMAAVVGHCYPLWHGFKGGKGAATALGMLAVVQPVLLVPMLVTWLLTLLLTGFVGLATVLAAASVALTVCLPGFSDELRWFAVALALFIAFTHRRNFSKMRSGTEHRFERAMLLRRRPK